MILDLYELPRLPEGTTLAWAVSSTYGIVPVAVVSAINDEHVVREMLLDSDGVPMDWDTKEVYAELCWIGKVYPTHEAAIADAKVALNEGVQEAWHQVRDAKAYLHAQAARCTDFHEWEKRGARLFASTNGGES